jgi:hypothetical protein
MRGSWPGLSEFRHSCHQNDIRVFQDRFNVVAFLAAPGGFVKKSPKKQEWSRGVRVGAKNACKNKRGQLRK